MEVPDWVMRSAQLAAALEVSGWPKPGNIHRTVDFTETRYEHFIAGAIAMGPAIRDAATRGVQVRTNKIDTRNLKLGDLILKSVTDINRWHKGGNTHLGTCLLFVPLAAAAGKTMTNNELSDLLTLQENVDLIMRSTTPQDAAKVYEAILSVSSKKELGEYVSQKAPDLYDPEMNGKLERSKVSLFDAMKIASRWDTVAKELVTAMNISFTLGHPTLMDTFEKTKDVNTSTVHTYLTILSKVPDTFIARKIGLKENNDVEKAVDIGRKKIWWISREAEMILKKGGLTTKEGKKAIWNLDEKLQRQKGLLNPGTTADLTASSLMISLLRGLRF